MRTITNLKVTSFIFITAALIVLTSCSGVSVETKDNFNVVELPDGSLAFLNHNSAISYDEKFSPRSLEVQGEVFLSVVEGESPFVVKSEHWEIGVLGTEFNVKSYAEELEVEVEEGIVELKTGIQSEKVRRGEAALYRTAEKEFKKVKAEFKFRIWMKELKAEFKKLGKEIKSTSKELGKQSKKAGKELKKELKKLK
jgi:ferric-dicitrate binding protein FerR (iron transport regulator)